MAFLADLDAETTGRLIAAAADVTLLVDEAGIIRDMAYDPAELPADDLDAWLGRPWLETVTTESRPKVDALLKDAAAGAEPRWRHLNHPIPSEPDLPILYSAVAVGPERGVMVVGRDLRPLASQQRQLVEAQQAMERDYLKMRDAETRYRLVLQAASDPILVVHAGDLSVTEANPAAVSLLGGSPKRVLGRSLLEAIEASSRPTIQALLQEAEAAGRADEAQARLAADAREVRVMATHFRRDGGNAYLVRLRTMAPPADTAATTTTAKLLRMVEQAPDALVVTEPDGRILWANRTFVDLAQLASTRQAEGQPLERWLGQPGLDLGMVIANTRQNGTLRLLSTTVRSEHAVATRVEVSVVAVADGEPRCFGFLIRDVSRRLGGEPRPARTLPRSVEQLTELVGQVPMRELVRETTDIIERLCIEAALQLSGDNRASAAEMLGLSRQSLYVKMRRYGLGDHDAKA